MHLPRQKVVNGLRKTAEACRTPPESGLGNGAPQLPSLKARSRTAWPLRARRMCTLWRRLEPASCKPLTKCLCRCRARQAAAALRVARRSRASSRSPLLEPAAAAGAAALIVAMHRSLRAQKREGFHRCCPRRRSSLWRRGVLPLDDRRDCLVHNPATASYRQSSTFLFCE